jgi:glycerol transport system ATP-binding protein
MSISAKNITKYIEGKVVLKNLDLEVGSDSFCSILGPAGVGKTTLLRILAGIEKPDSGNVFYDGVDMMNVPVQKRPISFVYQQFVNYPSMTIYENIASPLRVSKKDLSKTEINDRVQTTAKLLGIHEVLYQLPEEVSGGQQQRCAIARALAKESKYIFLDEPLSNLDYKLREELRNELKNIFNEREGIVVSATPDPIDTLTMATHVGFLHEHRILQYGEVKDVYENPSNLEVGSWFSYPKMNILPCEFFKHNGTAQLKINDELNIDIGSQITELNRGRYMLGIRAHHLSVLRENESCIPVKVIIELAEVVGSDMELHLKYENEKLVMLMQRVGGFSVGDEITIYIDPSQFYIFDVETGAFVGKSKGL